jgi:hypothetical protein
VRHWRWKLKTKLNGDDGQSAVNGCLHSFSDADVEWNQKTAQEVSRHCSRTSIVVLKGVKRPEFKEL